MGSNGIVRQVKQASYERNKFTLCKISIIFVKTGAGIYPHLYHDK